MVTWCDTLLKSLISTEHFWFQKIPNLKWWNYIYIYFKVFFIKSIVQWSFYLCLLCFKGCMSNERSLCRTLSVMTWREENVQTLSKSHVALSGILKTEFGKLSHLWVMVSLKVFTTETIFGLSLFDTSCIFYYMKYWIQLNIQNTWKLSWNTACYSGTSLCYLLFLSVFITTQFTD